MNEWEKFGAAIPFELKSLEEHKDEYKFEGYASIFDIPDKINDVMEKGAFKRTIDHHKGVFPLAWMHNREKIIGSATVHEDAKGLRVQPGILVKGVQQADDVYKLMKAKVVDGMSFSFRALQRQFKGKFRHLKEVAMGEVTVGPSSMICHPNALVTDVKFNSVTSILDTHIDRLKHIVGVKKTGIADKRSFKFDARSENEFKNLRSWTTGDGIEVVGGLLKDGNGIAVKSLRFPFAHNWTIDRINVWLNNDGVKMHEITAGMSYAISRLEIKIGSA